MRHLFVKHLAKHLLDRYPKLKRYAWPASVVLSGLLLYSAREQMPPGTDLVGALIALFGLGQQISGTVSDRIFERIGVIAQDVAEVKAEVKKGHTDLVKVAEDHADHLDAHQKWLKVGGYAPSKILRPAG